MKTREVLTEARKRLKDYNVDEREARLLLSHVLGVRSEELIKCEEINDQKADEFLSLIEKRCNHIPYAYLVGHKEFMKLDFLVDENVLIPRADTEILVENAIKICKEEYINNILDMCTGSGCIAIALAKYLDGANITAVDISEKALEIAKQNATNNNVEVEFVCSDLFSDINNKYEMIVSNPPYINKEDMAGLDEDVIKEPSLALDGGEDGLVFYRSIISNAKSYLESNGLVLFEIGYNQANDVSKILEENGFKEIKVFKDYSGNDRVVIARGG